jgi:hypothetical protein
MVEKDAESVIAEADSPYRDVAVGRHFLRDLGKSRANLAVRSNPSKGALSGVRLHYFTDKWVANPDFSLLGHDRPMQSS